MPNRDGTGPYGGGEGRGRGRCARRRGRQQGRDRTDGQPVDADRPLDVSETNAGPASADSGLAGFLGRAVATGALHLLEAAFARRPRTGGALSSPPERKLLSGDGNEQQER